MSALNGLLPLSLLPTAPSAVRTGDDPLFASYRSVPWLARTHAVTLVPSVSALQTLRKLPPGNPSRQPFIAFGDPYFNQAQADEGSNSDNTVEVADVSNVMGLKLDADWVVLSACNTGAGAGAGAEAASGLGRAFFYAGTRALLVTNWSVHSQSARQLVTDLFRRQGDDPKLTRGEALRQAMMALVDGPGYVAADGKTEFTYAHPLFWAPYSIIGDGGAR
jgi:hypothetical protein